MKVVLEDEIFRFPRTPLLLSILQIGTEGGHLVQTDPLFDSSADREVNRWLREQDRSARETAELAFRLGIDEDISGIPAEIVVHVGEVAIADWHSAPPRLSPQEALTLLRRPLRLLVENWRNDGAFLRTVAPEFWRERLVRALDHRWIELDHGGGSEMKPRLENASREESLRLWALFDSDAREPGQPSASSEAILHACKQRQVAHHRLRRRAIENYLPVKALEAWAHLGGDRTRRTTRRKAVAAFAAMRPEHRHHYNMKAGFEKDRPTGIPAFFEPHADHPDLQKGFGASIAELFHQKEFAILEDWMERDGQHAETVAMVQSILRRL